MDSTQLIKNINDNINIIKNNGIFQSEVCVAPIRQYAKKYPYRIIVEKSGKTYIVKGV